MIYRVDFKLITGLNVKLISPVIFSNIARVLFEIMDEDKAIEYIQLIKEKDTLISDMLPLKEIPILKNIGNTFKTFNMDLRRKREEYRKFKMKSRNECYSGDVFTRLRIQIDREKGCAKEKHLFLDEQLYFKKKIVYISIFKIKKYLSYLNLFLIFLKKQE